MYLVEKYHLNRCKASENARLRHSDQDLLPAPPQLSRVSVNTWAHVCACVHVPYAIEAKAHFLVLCVLSCSVESSTLRPHGLQPARLLCPWDCPGKDTGVGCHFLLQGIFPTQGLNPYLTALAGRFFTTEPPGERAGKGSWKCYSKNPTDSPASSQALSLLISPELLKNKKKFFF